MAAQVADAAGATDGVSVGDVDEFFTAFVPAARADRRGDWSAIGDTVADLKTRFSRRELRQFERVSRRLGALLEIRLRPLFLAARPPKLELSTHYEFVLFAQDLVADGRAAVEAVLTEPARSLERVATFTLERGLYLTALFRLDHLVWEAHKIRMLDAVLVRSSERFPSSDRAAAERKMEETSRRLWGVSKLTPFLRARFEGPEFAGGTPEQYPKFSELDSGEIVRTLDPANP
jgi:hypothetical protein